jgi:hypothetical protein
MSSFKPAPYVRVALLNLRRSLRPAKWSEDDREERQLEDACQGEGPGTVDRSDEHQEAADVRRQTQHLTERSSPA